MSNKLLQVNQLSILEENNYYPFGLKHGGHNPDQAGDIINSLDGDVDVGHTYQADFGASLPYLIYFPHTSKNGSTVYRISPYYVDDDAKINTHKSFIKF